MAAQFTLGPLALNHCTLTASRRGMWQAEVDAGEGAVPSGRVTLTLGTSQWSGTVVSAGLEHGRVKAFVVGALGLYTPIAPQHFVGSISELVTYLSGKAGETITLAGSSECTQWVLLAGTVKDALRAIEARTGLGWRVLPDGTVRVGPETWPAAELPAGYVEAASDPGTATTVYSAEDVSILPGQAVGGRKLESLKVSLDKNLLKISVWWQLAQVCPLGRGERSAYETVAHEDGNYARYRSLYPGKIASCNFAAQTCDVQPEHQSMPDLGSIPIRTGIPGLRVDIAVGQRVLVGFEGGDPDKPYAAPEWANTSQLVKATLDTTGILQIGTGSAQFVALENLVKAELSAIKSALDEVKSKFNAHTHKATALGADTTTPALALVPSVLGYTYTVGEVKASKFKTE